MSKTPLPLLLLLPLPPSFISSTSSLVFVGNIGAASAFTVEPTQLSIRREEGDPTIIYAFSTLADKEEERSHVRKQQFFTPPPLLSSAYKGGKGEKEELRKMGALSPLPFSLSPPPA